MLAVGVLEDRYGDLRRWLVCAFVLLDATMLACDVAADRASLAEDAEAAERDEAARTASSA